MDALVLRLAQHRPLSCGACGKDILPTLGKLDQTGSPLDAAVYDCNSGNCEWSRSVKLLDLSSSGATVAVEVKV